MTTNWLGQLAQEADRKLKLLEFSELSPATRLLYGLPATNHNLCSHDIAKLKEHWNKIRYE